MAVNIDWRAVRAGGSIAFLVAAPFSIAARWFADNGDGGSAPLWFSLLALIGFVLGSGAAAWVQDRDLPLIHGIVTAVLTYAVTQAVLVVVRLVMGRDVHWFAVFFNLTAVAVAGLIGGLLGSALHRRGVYPK